MEFGEALKLRIPPGSGQPIEPGRTGLFGRLGRWFPFVFPWSPLQRMTGAVLAGSGVALARGRLDGRYFHVDGAASIVGSDQAGSLANLDVPRGEPVCACLPRDKVMVRHFKVPTTSSSEIDSMLPHLLAAELPLATDHFSWVWTSLPRGDEGFTTIAVSVARNDQLEKFLAPLVEADLNLVGFVPEGWCWAHAIGQTRTGDDSPDDTRPGSVLIRGEIGHYLVVEAGGRLLFDAPVPDDSALAAAAGEFEGLLGQPLPDPEIWPDALQPTDGTKGKEVFFAASVAAAGLSMKRLMIPRERGLRSRRRTARGFAAGLARLAALVAVVWFAFALVEDARARRYLEGLEQQLIDDGGRVEILQMEYDAIRDSNRDRSGNTEVLQVLASLRRLVKVPIFLTHMNYLEGRGVTLRGTAPASANVLEMTEKLEADPLWKSLRVMQLRSEKDGGAKKVHFVVEGQLIQVTRPAEARDE